MKTASAKPTFVGKVGKTRVKGGHVVTANCPEAATAVLALDESGIVCNCNSYAEVLFQYCHSELVGRHVSQLLPQLKGVALIQNDKANPRFHFLCRVGRQFHGMTQAGEQFATTLLLNVLDTQGCGRITLIVRPTLIDQTQGAGQINRPN